MAVEFTNEHVVGVTGFVLAVFFCRGLVDCIQTAIVLCDGCPLWTCHHGCHKNLMVGFKLVLFSFNAVQPVIMSLAAPVRAAFAGEPPLSRVFVVNLSVNVTSLTGDEPVHTITTGSLSALDLRFAAIPFSMLACISTAVWVNLGKDGVFNQDPLWDCDFFADNERIWLYETVYYAELLLMCVALVATSTLPQTAAETLYLSMTITALLMFFASTSRYQNRSQAGMCMSTTAFALLCAIISSFALTGIDTSCALAVLAGTALVGIVISTATFHYIAAGSFKTGNILLVRTLLSNTCSVILIATLAVGRTSSCVSHPASHGVDERLSAGLLHV